MTPQEIEALKAERDALLAQNKELGRLLAAAENQTEQLTRIALGEISINDIKAEAGRAGYLQGHSDASDICNEWSKKHSEKHADEYAAKVRQGGAE